MSKILETIDNCKKEKLNPRAALAVVALLFHGAIDEENNASEKEIYDYCDNWVDQNGEITYGNLRKFAKNLGYEGEIVEIWMENCRSKD